MNDKNEIEFSDAPLKEDGGAGFLKVPDASNASPSNSPNYASGESNSLSYATVILPLALPKT
ncbi:MAG: hypothetical protein WKI04_15915, partial [Ferruginibacter sp.]